jgi:hypothetical protein
VTSLAVVDPGPLARMEEVKSDATAPSVVFQRMTADKPETLREIARAWGVPAGRFVEWFTTEHSGMYDAALKVLAADYAHDSIGIADGAAKPEDVPAAKLQVDTRLRVASKWDRKRYGDEVESRVQAPVTIQIANLRGAALEVNVPALQGEVKVDVVPQLQEPEQVPVHAQQTQPTEAFERI